MSMSYIKWGNSLFAKVNGEDYKFASNPPLKLGPLLLADVLEAVYRGLARILMRLLLQQVGLVNVGVIRFHVGGFFGRNTIFLPNNGPVSIEHYVKPVPYRSFSLISHHL